MLFTEPVASGLMDPKRRRYRHSGNPDRFYVQVSLSRDHRKKIRRDVIRVEDSFATRVCSLCAATSTRIPAHCYTLLTIQAAPLLSAMTVLLESTPCLGRGLCSTHLGSYAILAGDIRLARPPPCRAR